MESKTPRRSKASATDAAAAAPVDGAATVAPATPVTTAAPKEKQKPVRNWLARWQEFIGWLPILLLLSIGGWVLLGGITDRNDLIRWLLELPVLTCNALAALGVAYLARRRQRRKLTPTESADLWTRALNGERGALIIYLTDVSVWAITFAISFAFFWPRR